MKNNPTKFLRNLLSTFYLRGLGMLKILLFYSSFDHSSIPFGCYVFTNYNNSNIIFNQIVVVHNSFYRSQNFKSFQNHLSIEIYLLKNVNRRRFSIFRLFIKYVLKCAQRLRVAQWSACSVVDRGVESSGLSGSFYWDPDSRPSHLWMWIVNDSVYVNLSF